MPEAPDLEVVKEILTRRVKGRHITSAQVLRPTVLRSLATQDFVRDVAGRTVESVSRQGKFLLMAFSGDVVLVVNPMLTGALRLCAPSEKVLNRTCVVMELDGQEEVRYLDDKQMGQVYYVRADQLELVPRLWEQGPDVLDGGITFEQFQGRLRRYHGEIKGILTRGAVISGIGNAYSDEILFVAGISPFRKRATLSDEELKRLFSSARRVVTDAVGELRGRMGEDTHQRIRDFLQIHNKGGQPCPRCRNTISQLTANQRITSYCRHCQPGMLVRN